MEDIIINIIRVVVTMIIIPLISFLGKTLINYLESKSMSCNFSENTTKIELIITNAVKAVFQTYVDALKKSNSFDEKAQKEALAQAKAIIAQHISTNMKEFIIEHFGEYDTWIETQIEAAVHTIKCIVEQVKK